MNQENTSAPAENKMGTMPIGKLLFNMSLPMMISMLVQALYNIVDSIFVAKLSENALTAVSLAFPLQTLLIAVGTGTGVGMNALLSKSLGEKNFKKANATASNAAVLYFFSYLVFFILGFTIVRPFYASQIGNADQEIMELLKGRKSITIYNKTDLTPVVDIEFLKEKTASPVIPISAVEETGISQLEDEIRRMFFQGELSFNDEVYITNARHKAALEEALESLKLVKNSIEMGMAEDFFSIDLMNAYESLGRIVGESVGEDLVNEIFSKFCVGK